MALSQLRSDIVERKNLDVYVTVVAAVVVGALSVFDVLPVSKISGITLGILAILAFNSLATRAAVERARNSGGTLDRFTSYFPPELIGARESSRNVYICGLDLTRTIDQSFGAFQANLRFNNMRLRVLVVDPEAEESALDAKHPRSGPDSAAQRAKIEASLRKLYRLRQDAGDRLQVRTTRVALTFGVNYLDVDRSSAVLYVQLYSYRLGGECRPMMKLTHADGEWFDCYHEQVEELWDNAVEFDFGRLGL